MTEIRKAFEIRSTLRKSHGEIVMLNQKLNAVDRFKWSSKEIKTPMTRLDPKYNNLAIKCFRKVQMIMEDRKEVKTISCKNDPTVGEEKKMILVR